MDYEPFLGARGALPAILRSYELQSYMTRVASSARAQAQVYVALPQAVISTTEVRRDRWHAIVTNTSPGARYEEWGGRGRPGRHPLGRVLDSFRAADPNRRRGARWGP